MSGLHTDLVIWWYLLLDLVLLLVVLLHGFDLGVGILSLFVRREEERGVLLASVATIWHANQTWLVVLGAILFGAFPLVYGLVLSALYIPVALMLLGFIFRGVSLEYYPKAENKRLWGLAFGLGSLAAALGQGFALGSLLGGLPLSGQRFVGGSWAWLSPFSSLAALGVLGAFVLSGASWLVFKAKGAVQDKALHAARSAAFFLLIAAPTLIIWAAWRHPFLSSRWLAWPGMLLTSLPLALAVVAFVLLVISLARRWEGACFIFSSLLLSLVLLALLASIYPLMILPGISAFQGAAGKLNLEFMLVGVVLVLPLMLAYNAYQYWVFRGKIVDSAEYE